MRIYELTKLSTNYLSRDGSDGSEDYKILSYIRDRCGGHATESQLEFIADRFQLDKLRDQGLIKELTQEKR